MRRREDEDEKTYFRSDRTYSMNGQWYFGTREGDCGPFASRERALAALARFVNEMVELGSFQKSREREPVEARVGLPERLRPVERGQISGMSCFELLI